MRTTVQATGSATATTPWVPVSDSQNPFNVELYGLPDSVFAATSYQLQYSGDDPQTTRQVTFTTSGTTATVTDTAHGLATGDSIVMTGTGSSADVTADITVTDVNTYTYVTGASPPAKGIGKVASVRWVNLGAAITTGRAATLLQNPCRVVRAKLAGWTVGILNLLVVQAASRTN